MRLVLVFARLVCLTQPMTYFKTSAFALRKTLFSLSLALGVSTAALAGETPSTVVELFTSQGCSSCPPANEFVGNLSDDKDVLVLTYGVTYWDYLGWKDTFGDPAFTQRQREYGQAFGIGNVYTPQIVLNGSAHSPRYNKADVRTMTLPQQDTEIDLLAKGGQLVLNSQQDAVLVSYKAGWHEVPVKAGENHGRTLRLANVVTAVTPVKAGENFSQVIEDGISYAALVHHPETMKVLSASVYAP